jgi:hypothetical protein
MDASQITKLLQKQNMRYINRCQTVDSSTLTWQNQIQSAKYIKGVKTCEGAQNWNVPTNPACSEGNGICSFGGAGRTTSIQTGSPKQFLNVLAGAAGSAGHVYSSEAITLQRAGKESCGVANTIPAPANSYIVLPGGDPTTSDAQLQVPSCSYICSNTNGPTPSNPDIGQPGTNSVNNNLNPYLPPFDTYYAMKNPTCNYPIQDQNQKHFVKFCATCPGDAPTTMAPSNPTHPYVIENPPIPQIQYDLCIGGGDVPLPTLPADGSTALPSVINGPLPASGSYSVQISPINNNPNTTLININPLTGEITWTGVPSPIGGYFIITYSGPNIPSITTGPIFIDTNACA